jgi:hypothetical protein
MEETNDEHISNEKNKQNKVLGYEKKHGKHGNCWLGLTLKTHI